MSRFLSLESDLRETALRLQPMGSELSNRTILLTGGTGFFGKWILSTLCFLNDEAGLRSRLLVLSRDPQSFLRRHPEFDGRSDIEWITGDVRDADLSLYRVQDVIHAATEASDKLNREAPMQMFETIVKGTENIATWAKAIRAERFLLTSSGAVYGTQPQELSHFSEDYPVVPVPTDKRSAYAEGKKEAEVVCQRLFAGTGTRLSIARCFAFVGPYLPLDTHFAIGNFILDGLQSRPITILGDGLTRRSYLYATDLVVWLLTLLCRAPSGVPYNVGSGESLSLLEVAEIVADTFTPRPAIEVRKPVENPKIFHQYVPSVEKIKQDLGLEMKVPLDEAVRRTVSWASEKVRRTFPERHK